MVAAYDVLAPLHEQDERDAALAALRRDDPVHWDPANEWWLVTRHADVREVSRRPELFSSEPRGPWHVFEYHFSMQAMDGERHRRHRKVVSHAFTPRLVATMGERAERYADEAIDALAGRRTAEFVTDLAVPVPLRIIADMLGVADADLDQFRTWSDALVLAGGGHGDAAQLEETNRLMGDFLGYLSEAVERRRAEPRDDLLSHIIQAGESGVLDGTERFHLEGDEVRDFALFLLVAGNETTRNAISQGMLALLNHPAERDRLAVDPSLWDTATDEILRWTSPVRAMRRVAMRDTTLGDRKILEGQSVVMVYASANRDEAIFDEPHRFRVDRDPNEHLAFGFGPHYCLGSNLARMEVRTVLRRVLARLPGMRLASGAQVVQTPSALIDGLDALPVEW
jgi:cytochrome P450 family 142 subfamily A polypeptide 1